VVVRRYGVVNSAKGNLLLAEACTVVAAVVLDVLVWSSAILWLTVYLYSYYALSCFCFGPRLFCGLFGLENRFSSGLPCHFFVSESLAADLSQRKCESIRVS
jgi:hypothetical protein